MIDKKKIEIAAEKYSAQEWISDECRTACEDGFCGGVEWYAQCENALPKQIDWEQRRYELAKSAIIGILASPIVDGIDPNPSVPELARHTVVIADAIIKELKGK